MIRALLLSLMLGGCTSQVVTRPYEVQVPIAVPCKVPAVPHPEWPTSALKPSDDIFTKVRALLVELDMRRSYEAKLEAAAQACR